MAHEVETLTYANAVPWHGLGEPLPEEGLRDWRVACETAGLNWTVEQRALHLADRVVPHTLGLQVTHKANVRSSDDKVLGVVGPDYEVLQNCEVFEWFAPILEAEEATIEAAGSLRGGSRIFALARITDADGEVRGEDRVKRYILLSHSHDGTLAVRVGLTDIRVVCHNTLTFAHESKGSELIRLRHTRNIKDNLDNVRRALDVTRKGFFADLELYRKLADKNINPNDVRRYVEIVFDALPTAHSINTEPAPLHARTEKRIQQIVDRAFYQDVRGRRTPDDTVSVWDAYNAVTEYTSWTRGRTNDTRLNSVWFGDSAKVNQRARKAALELVQVR